MAGLILTLLGILGCVPTSRDSNTRTPEFVLPTVDVGAGTLFRGSFSPSGTEFYYFVKVRPEGEDYRIYRMDRTELGWSRGAKLALGDSAASSMYPAISPDDRLLVFTSYRPRGGQSENANLWVAQRSGSGWSAPRLLEQTSTADQYDAAPWFGPGGALHFVSTSSDWSQTWMRKAPRVRDTFGAWTEDTLWSQFDVPPDTHHLWSGITNRAGNIAILELSAREREGGLGDSNLWLSRLSNGVWSPPEPLGADVNTDGTENFATFAPDDMTVVFVRDFTEFHSVTVGH